MIIEPNLELDWDYCSRTETCMHLNVFAAGSIIISYKAFIGYLVHACLFCIACNDGASSLIERI